MNRTIMSKLTNEVVNRGYKSYDWNVSSGDAAGGRPTSIQIKNNVINNCFILLLLINFVQRYKKRLRKTQSFLFFDNSIP